MITSIETKKIKEIVSEFFQKMTFAAEVEVKIAESGKENIDLLTINVKCEEPQILIGEKGQTLIEIQKLLARILIKKIDQPFYIDLDINDYKKKKLEYLKNLAKDLADEVALTKEEKILSPMPSYERRIIHLELANRSDVITESQGEEPERKVIIKPR